MNDLEVEQRVRQYLVGNHRFHGTPEALSSDYRLIERGVLDSMGIFEVVSFLENHYGIQIEDQDLVPQNFESLKAISKLVTKKGAG
jgi:acyl carrier protein